MLYYVILIQTPDLDHRPQTRAGATKHRASPLSPPNHKTLGFELRSNSAAPLPRKRRQLKKTSLSAAEADDDGPVQASTALHCCDLKVCGGMTGPMDKRRIYNTYLCPANGV